MSALAGCRQPRIAPGQVGRTLAGLSVLISQACLSRHLSEMMDRIAKGPEDVKKSVRAADELP